MVGNGKRTQTKADLLNQDLVEWTRLIFIFDKDGNENQIVMKPEGGQAKTSRSTKYTQQRPFPLKTKVGLGGDFKAGQSDMEIDDLFIWDKILDSDERDQVLSID